MLPATILNQWASKCREAGISWHLYRETLLCANGLEEFPPYLSHAQVVISPEDLSKIPTLDPNWRCQQAGGQLSVYQDDQLILTVYTLENLQSGGTVTCGNVEYPVFAGFENYLSDTYGDYENGLTDAIGVGLTAEEKDALRTHQLRSKEALRFIQDLSEEYGLRYFLLAGSVLGAVRHGGFIPWDDDVDIGIRIEDLSRFEEIVKEQLPLRLPEGFSLRQPEAGQPYPRMFSKICYQGRCCIDLWPLVPTKPEGLGANFIWYCSKFLTKGHYESIGYHHYPNRKAGKLISAFLNDRQILALAHKNERAFSTEKAPAYINLYSVYSRRKETISRRWLDTPATACFEGIGVPIVGCTEEYLTQLYGDYMTLPAPWNRASRHFERF